METMRSDLFRRAKEVALEMKGSPNAGLQDGLKAMLDDWQICNRLVRII
jgi:hypothetical protein